MPTMYDDLSFEKTKVNQPLMNDDDISISSGDDNSLNSTIKESTNAKKTNEGLSKTNDEEFQMQRETLQSYKDNDSCNDVNVRFQILRSILNNTEKILTVLGKTVIDIQDLKQRYTVFENSDECTSAKSLILDKIKDFLPLENKEAVTEFELYLSKSVENRKGLQQISRQVGGTNGEDYSRRVFALLFSPSFAQNNTWEGKKTKYSIKNLTVIAIVEELILQKFPTWTSADFGKTGINWFRLGNQRSGKQPGQLQKKNES
ncbi:hypothetical protein PV328_012144 [Microctonus aethiopoides]|uniref:DUF4806 domain-containing protein n=1 Tax=Microctonus aethiopoides TaxID=144406 RepID=A0AA39KPW8_9HYME|nr:hypothetical protein PV328_012144 [Microctonus aethiopoides]